jgi:hypothetical protein
MGASKYPNTSDGTTQIVNADGNTISPSNPLDTSLTGNDNQVKLVDQAGTLISSSNGLNTVVNNDIKFDYSQNAVKLMDESGTLISDANGLNVKLNDDIKFDYSKNAVKLMDESGTLISDANGLNVKVNNGIKIVDASNPSNSAEIDSDGNLQVKVNNLPDGIKIIDAGSGNPVSASNPLDTQLIGTQNKVKLVDDEGNLINEANGLNVKVNGTPEVTLSGTDNSVRLVDNQGVDISESNGLNVKLNGTPTVNIGTMPPVNVGEVEVKNDEGNPVNVSLGFGGNPAQPAYTQITNSDITVKNTSTTPIYVESVGIEQVYATNIPGSTLAVSGEVSISNMPDINVSSVEINNEPTNPVPISGTVDINDTNPIGVLIQNSNDISVVGTVSVDSDYANPVYTSLVGDVSVSSLPLVSINPDANTVTVDDTVPVSVNVSNANSIPISGSVEATILGNPVVVVDDNSPVKVLIQNSNEIPVSFQNQIKIDATANTVKIDGTTEVEIKNGAGSPIPVSGSVSVTGSNVQAVIANGLGTPYSPGNPLFVQSSLTYPVYVGGEVEIKNEQNNPIPVSGSVTVTNLNAIHDVNITNGQLEVEVLNPPTNINVDNFPTTQDVNVLNTGFDATITNAVLTVDGDVSVITIPPIEIAENQTVVVSGTVDANITNEVLTVDVNNLAFPEVQTVDGTVLIDSTTPVNVTVDNPVTSVSVSNLADISPPTEIRVNNTSEESIPVTFSNTSIEVSNLGDITPPTELRVNNLVTDPVFVNFTNTTVDVGTITSLPAVKLDASQNTVKLDATENTVKIAASQSVNIGTMPNVTVSNTGFQIVDKTNSAHIASVSNNGSVHTVITNDSGSAVPTQITNAPTVKIDTTANNVNVGTPTVKLDATDNTVKIASGQSVNVGTLPSITIANTGFNVNNTPTVKLDATDNTVKIAASQSVNIGTMPSVSFGAIAQPVNIATTGNSVKITDGTNTVDIVSDPVYGKALKMVLVGSIDGGNWNTP